MLLQKIKMKILLGQEYLSDDEEPDSEEASDGEKEDARDTFVDRTTVRASDNSTGERNLFEAHGVLGVPLCSIWG